MRNVKWQPAADALSWRSPPDRIGFSPKCSGPSPTRGGLKVTLLVAGMVAGADSIDDMAVLCRGGMGRIFIRTYAPSTLGSFLRAFTFGHVRQLDAIASRFLTRLAGRAPLIVPPPGEQMVMVDIDDTIIEVHGHGKHGSVTATAESAA